MSLDDYVMTNYHMRQNAQRKRWEEEKLGNLVNDAANAEFVSGGGLRMGQRAGLLGDVNNLSVRGPYDQPDEDLQTLVTNQFQQQILSDALDAESWEKEKTRLIQEDNKLSMLVSVITGQPYKPMSLSSNTTVGTARAKANTKSKKLTMEKSIINNRLVENPPRTLSEANEFGNSLNLSPDGWTYLKSRFEMLDWGKSVEWQKINDDGSLQIAHALEGDEAANNKLRDQNFTTKSLSSRRNDRVAQGWRSVNDTLHKVLITQNKKLSQFDETVLDEMKELNPELFTNPFAIPAINQLIDKYLHTKPLKVLMLRADGTQKVIDNNDEAILKAQKDGYVLADKEGINTQFKDNAREQFVDEIVGQVGKLLKPYIETHPELVETQIKDQIARMSVGKYSYLANDDNIVKSVLGKMGIETQKAMNNAIIYNYMRGHNVMGNKNLTQQQMLAKLREGVPVTINNKEQVLRLSKTQMEAMTKEVLDMHKPVEYAKTVQGTGGITVMSKSGNPVYANINTSYTRGPDNKLIPLSKEAEAWPTTDEKKKLWVPVYQQTGVDESGNPVFAKLSGAHHWQPTDAWRTPVVADLRKNITEREFQAPTQLNDAVVAYEAITDALQLLGEGGEEISVGFIDKHIGTLIIKLRDTSMVTEGEFEALADTAGLLDKIKHITESMLEGHVFTPTQRTSALKLVDSWLRGKIRIAKAKVDEQTEALERRLTDSIYDHKDGTKTLGDMDEFIDGLMRQAGVPLDILSKELRPLHEVLATDVSGLFKPISKPGTTPTRRDGKSLDIVERELDEKKADSSTSASDLLKKRKRRGQR